ncbi:type II toxin-antitoxin system RelE/ParE family toxin [Schleiferilactobacillus harbinensis]|uniref:Type II toxin-antitoxin system RelE/ParE family toxin n=1 Tax=Schleiferilactobacillus harbinensis TaxID=304207 RepID=A0ABU7T2L8_9LACO|nr:type II toxin-antitoxin system RelE/ParE family toxin [Schleiferilactobacillus harbinensis]QFR62661.1 type II toxin-antitoxin system RelE/ParE family toxin [Schleiferilactobacillus harbinensis]
MAYNVKPEPRVLKYVKKIKNRELKKLFTTAIYEDIANDPEIGEEKVGDLAGYRVLGFKYADTSYRVAYIITEDVIVVVILAGPHENFYRDLKSINRKSKS